MKSIVVPRRNGIADLWDADEHPARADVDVAGFAIALVELRALGKDRVAHQMSCHTSRP